jgi:DNA-binding NtrC family response regulator
VHVYSERGLGTTFKVYLPRPSGVSPEAASLSFSTASNRDVEDELSLSESAAGATVLVVDDEEPVRRAVERILSRAGYKVTTADGAPNALDELRKQEFDLLVTDVVLVGPTDGVSLAAEARLLRPQLSTLFMTGYARGRLRDLQLFHLRKPFSARELLLQVRRALAA